MEDNNVCSSGREPLGLRFTIDYLLYNKGGKSEKHDSKESAAPLPEEVPETSAEEQSEETTPEERREQEAQVNDEEEKEEEGEGAKSEQTQGTGDSESQQEKPNQSYIALISMAILASEEKKLLLCDIYQWIMDHYPYFKSKDKNWRNSVRHNLSLNECFIKAGRSENGKGHFWAIHPANLQDFSNGDYHRRGARRRIRRAARHLPYALPVSYHPLAHPKRVPCWCCPPAQHLHCLPTRIYWSWTGTPPRRTPSLQTLL
ncbi:forkhead box Q2 [Chanos chanos]|uniref:Forkhead box Q2 n=1 Tax=Chanos chanos TaxID=29144 RepID=A0A6J2W7J1_CHACN|nr:forkhead box protein B2-like [Chanos chanos]